MPQMPCSNWQLPNCVHGPNSGSGTGPDGVPGALVVPSGPSVCFGP